MTLGRLSQPEWQDEQEARLRTRLDDLVDVVRANQEVHNGILYWNRRVETVLHEHPAPWQGDPFQGFSR